MGDGADGMSLEKVDLDVEQPVENIFRHTRIDARRDDLKEIVAQIEQHRFEHEEQGYADAKDGEGVEGAVFQHLAGDYAPEHHRREGEEGEGEGAEHQVPQQALLAKEQRHHQAPAEGLLFVEQLVVAPDEDQLARPDLLQAHLIDDDERPFLGVGVAQLHMRNGAVRLDIGQDHRLAALQFDDGGKRLLQMFEIVEAELDDPRLQARLPGAGQKLLDRDALAGEQVVLDELRDGQVETVRTADDRKAAQPRRRSVAGPLGLSGQP